jgi:signal transduction histidine kinase
MVREVLMSVERPSRATGTIARQSRAGTRRVAIAAGPAAPLRDFEEELRRQEDLHRLACEAGRTGSWYVCLDSMECTLSPMAAALLGLPAQALTLPPETWRSRIGSAHLPGLEEAVRAGAADGTSFEFEFMVTRRDSRELWLHLRGEVVADASGRPVRVHGALVDLSEQKRAKDELERLNETLELRVAERTAALLETQEALRQAQKVEAMGQLTGGIAHDFNNLLTPILANLDLLRHSAAGERDRRLIDGALRSAGSAQSLVQRLLAFARRQALQPTRVELPALIEGLAELVARTLGPRIRIALDLAPGLEPALADRNQLEMAILNLGVNARDAMPEGGTLTISAANETVSPGHEARLAPGSYVRLSIVDTGIGMDEKVRRRAIEPFYSTKGVGKGTGLGLSMVDGLASQMGGAFSLWSSCRCAGTGARAGLRARRRRLARRRSRSCPCQHRRDAGRARLSGRRGHFGRRGRPAHRRRPACRPDGDRSSHAGNQRRRARRPGTAAPSRAAGAPGVRLFQSERRSGGPALPRQACRRTHCPGQEASGGDCRRSGGAGGTKPSPLRFTGKPAG